MNMQEPTESPDKKSIDLSTLSGLTGLQLMIDGLIPNPPIAKTMNFWLVAVAKGEAVFEGTPGPEVCNPMGGVHGGWFMAVGMAQCLTVRWDAQSTRKWRRAQLIRRLNTRLTLPVRYQLE
jgi:hypothetical protein